MKDYFTCDPKDIDKFILLEYITGDWRELIKMYGDNSCIITIGKHKKKATFKSKYEAIKELYPDTLIITPVTDFYAWITGNKKGDLSGYVNWTKGALKCVKDTYTHTDKYLYEIVLNTLDRYYKGLKPITPYDNGFKYKEINIKDLNEINFIEPIAIDIETYNGLRVNEAKLYTVAITDYELNSYVFKYEPEDKEILKEFLNKYKKQIYHNASYDLKVFITNLYMQNEDDLDGMLKGIEWVRSLELNDTMLMIYSKFNSTQGNELGLKFNSLHLSGSYALDVSDVTKYPIEDIMEYNAIDTWNTMKLFQEHSDTLDFKAYRFNVDSIPYLLEEMIIGLPISKERLDEVYDTLKTNFDKIELSILINRYVLEATDILIEAELKKKNSKLKTKVLTKKDINFTFNPGSGKQLVTLLYEVCKLPIIEYTKTKQPSTSGDTIKTLKNYTDNEEIIKLLDLLKDYFDLAKIITGFLEPFKEYIFYRPSTGTYWLTGNHKLGGTVSNRLSSNEPNLANLPSNSKYGKVIKSIFIAPDNWLFAGSDYSALEDRIVANLSKDPMKMGVFTKGIDGHSLNAYGYFKEEFDKRGITIDTNDPNSINSIKKLAPDLRQESKTYTFGMNYGQEAPGMSKNQGIPLEKAEKIVAGYKKMYHVLVEWNESNKKFMNKYGYVEGCWGHRVYTPLISKSIINRKITPSKVKAEFRSANNAITQSYGMLTTIAGKRFQDELFKSKYRYDVLLINQIHDAIYLLIRKEPEVIKWVNDTLIKVMCIMDEPKLIDAPVKLESELDLGVSWRNQNTLKNNASIEEIQEFIKEI